MHTLNQKVLTSQNIYLKKKNLLENEKMAPAGVAQWIKHWPANQKV